MADTTIRFDDGAAYEQAIGVWSRLVGVDFLDWIEPSPGLRWLDVGCGTGVFTELLVERCAPAEVHGIEAADDTRSRDDDTRASDLSLALDESDRFALDACGLSARELGVRSA